MVSGSVMRKRERRPISCNTASLKKTCPTSGWVCNKTDRRRPGKITASSDARMRSSLPSSHIAFSAAADRLLASSDMACPPINWPPSDENNPTEGYPSFRCFVSPSIVGSLSVRIGVLGGFGSAPSASSSRLRVCASAFFLRCEPAQPSRRPMCFCDPRSWRCTPPAALPHVA